MTFESWTAWNVPNLIPSPRRTTPKLETTMDSAFQSFNPRGSGLRSTRIDVSHFCWISLSVPSTRLQRLVRHKPSGGDRAGSVQDSSSFCMHQVAKWRQLDDTPETWFTVIKAALEVLRNPTRATCTSTARFHCRSLTPRHGSQFVRNI